MNPIGKSTQYCTDIEKIVVCVPSVYPIKKKEKKKKKKKKHIKDPMERKGKTRTPGENESRLRVDGEGRGREGRKNTGNRLIFSACRTRSSKA